MFAQFSKDIFGAHDGVLAVRARFSFETERVLEVECDNCGARELEQEISQCADSDRVRDCGPFGVWQCGVALVHFGPRGGFQAVKQIVRFHAQPLAAADFHVRLLRFFLAQCVFKLGGATRRKRYDLVGKVNRAISLLVETQRTKSRDDDVLQIRLSRINDVVNQGSVSEGGRIGRAAARNAGPKRLAVRVGVELFVLEITAE